MTIECEEFYDLMQAYRHAPFSVREVHEKYHAVIDYVDHIAGLRGERSCVQCGEYKPQCERADCPRAHPPAERWVSVNDVFEITSTAGQGFSDYEIIAQGRNFGDWEAGFLAACNAIESSVKGLLPPLPPAPGREK